MALSPAARSSNCAPPSKQGEVESRFFLQEKMIHDLLYHVADASHLGDEARRAWYRKLLTGDARMENEAFREIDGVKRCLSLTRWN